MPRRRQTGRGFRSRKSVWSRSGRTRTTPETTVEDQPLVSRDDVAVAAAQRRVGQLEYMIGRSGGGEVCEVLAIGHAMTNRSGQRNRFGRFRGKDASACLRHLTQGRPVAAWKGEALDASGHERGDTGWHMPISQAGLQQLQHVCRAAKRWPRRSNGFSINRQLKGAIDRSTAAVSGSWR